MPVRVGKLVYDRCDRQYRFGGISRWHHLASPALFECVKQGGDVVGPLRCKFSGNFSRSLEVVFCPGVGLPGFPLVSVSTDFVTRRGPRFAGLDVRLDSFGGGLACPLSGTVAFDDEPPLALAPVERDGFPVTGQRCLPLGGRLVGVVSRHRNLTCCLRIGHRRGPQHFSFLGQSLQP